MGKNQGFLTVNLSKARDNSTWAVSWLAELTVTPLPSPSFPSLSSVCPSQKPPCVDSKRPRVYRHQARMGVFERTHGDTTHTTQHHNTQHHTETDRETQRQRQTETERDREKQRETERDRERETRQEKKREDKTIKEKKREDEKGETRR